MASFRIIIAGLVLLLTYSSSQTLTVLTHNSFDISSAVIEAFTEQTGIRVTFLSAGDAGEVVNRAILTKDNPLADLLFGIDNSLLIRAQQEGIFEPYFSPQLGNVNPRYLFDPNGFVTPVTVGYVNFNLDEAFFAAEPQRPSDITDLTQEAYRGLTVVSNPTTSSPGLAFMLATIARFGTEGDYTWLDYWADLRDNDLLVSGGWSDAYYTAFSRYGGDRPIVLSYATSPAAEVIFAEEAQVSAPTSNLFCVSCVYEQIEAVGILRGTQQLEAAQMFIDFMLSEAFQEDIPLNMFVYPVVSDITLPEAFELYGELPTPTETALLDMSVIESELRNYLRQWTQVVEQGRNPADL